MKAVLEFKTELEAWNWIHNNFKGKQWYHDDIASEKAGYEVYRDCDEYYNYVCCLGDRLELNVKKDNKTYNLWIMKNDIEDDIKNYRTYELEKTEIDTICDALYLCCSASASSDIQTRQFKNVDEIIYKLNLIKKLHDGWVNF